MLDHKGLFRCKQNIGFGRWNDRFILLHAPTREVVILKPNASSSSGTMGPQSSGRSVVLKRRRRIQNLSIERSAGKRGIAKQVVIRSAKDSKNFTFDFATAEQANTFRSAFVKLWQQSVSQSGALN